MWVYRCNTLFNPFYAKHFVLFPWDGIQIQQSFNRIVWLQKHHFCIKVQRIKIGNILPKVIVQERSQIILQITREKDVFVFDDHQSSENKQRRNTTGMALNLPVSRQSGRITHLNFVNADLWALFVTHSAYGSVSYSSLFKIYVLNVGSHVHVFFQLLRHNLRKAVWTKCKSMIWFPKKKSSQFKLTNTWYTCLLQSGFSCLSQLNIFFH